MKKRNSFAILTIAGAAVLAMTSCAPAEPDKPDPKPEHQHTYSELHAKVEPTCLSEGVKAYYSCTGCDLLFNENKEVISQPEAISALAHTPHHHDATDPSCTEAGTGEYWTCDNVGDEKLYGDQDCKEVIQSVPVVDPKGHKLSHMDGNPASCSEAGWKEYYKCDDCDALFEDAQGKTSIADLEAWKKGAGKLDLAPHSAQLVAGQASTCKEHGWKDYYHCGGCDGYFEDQAATKPIEDLAAWKVGAGKLELAAHKPVIQDGQEPTCISDGWKNYYKCSVCNRMFEDEACQNEITNFDEWKVNAGKLPMGEHGHKLVAGKASTCKEHGYEDAYLCEGCGKYFEDAEAKTLIGDADAYEAWKVAGGQLPFAAHKPVKQDGKASSCTENGWADYYKCSVCDRMFEEEACETEITNLDAWKVGDGQLPLLNHENSKINGKAATCEEAGWKDYYQCSECEGYFEDEAGTTPIADLAAWKVGVGKIDPKGHDENLTKTDAVAPTCYQTGVKEYYKCESCGKYFEDAAAVTGIPDLAAWKADAGLVPATGDHDFDYSNVEVSWNGVNATAVAKCSTEGCVETVSETKEGSYVKDTDATCTTPEKGHYEVTFNNTNLGSARTAANSVDNGEPHAHTYGDLVPQVDAVRENTGTKAHYQCSECNGYFDESYDAISENDLVIEAPARHFDAAANFDWNFKTPIEAGSKMTIDLKFVDGDENSKVYVQLFGANASGGCDWDSCFGGFNIYADKVGDNPAGVSLMKCDDGYTRVTFDLNSITKKSGTPNGVAKVFFDGRYTNVGGYVEVNSNVDAHTLGALVPEVAPTLHQNGYAAHYVCENCGALFDESGNLTTDDALVIETIHRTTKDSSYTHEFAEPVVAGEKVVFDFKLDDTGDQYMRFTLYGQDWNNYSWSYVIDKDAVLNCVWINNSRTWGTSFTNKEAPGVQSSLVNEEPGWIRVVVDTALIGKSQESMDLSTFTFMHFEKGPNASIEVYPQSGTINRGTLITKAHQTGIALKPAVSTGILNIDVKFVDEMVDGSPSQIRLNMHNTDSGWHGFDDIYLKSDGTYNKEYLPDYFTVVKVEPKGMYAGNYLRLIVDVDKLLAGTGYSTLSQVTVESATNSDVYIQINPTEDFEIDGFHYFTDEHHAKLQHNVAYNIGNQGYYVSKALYFEFKGCSKDSGDKDVKFTLAGNGENFGGTNIHIKFDGTVASIAGDSSPAYLDDLGDGIYGITIPLQTAITNPVKEYLNSLFNNWGVVKSGIEYFAYDVQSVKLVDWDATMPFSIAQGSGYRFTFDPIDVNSGKKIRMTFDNVVKVDDDIGFYLLEDPANNTFDGTQKGYGKICIDAAGGSHENCYLYKWGSDEQATAGITVVEATPTSITIECDISAMGSRNNDLIKPDYISCIFFKKSIMLANADFSYSIVD